MKSCMMFPMISRHTFDISNCDYCTLITYKVAVINEKITIISATQYNGFNFS